MRAMLVGGGVLDLATLHPLATLALILIAGFGLRAILGAAGSIRRERRSRR